MKKAIVYFLTVVMAIGLTACGNSNETDSGGTAQTSQEESTEEEESEKEGPSAGEVNIALSSDPGSLAPWEAAADGKKMYIEMYETLFNYESFGGDFVGIIGKSYEQLDDYTYRIQIYDYVTDSNGNKITADDIVWSYEQCIEIGGYVNRTVDIADIEVVDDYTLDFTYSKVLDYAAFCESMMINIVDQDTFEELGESEFNLHPIATGPYVLEDYTAGSFYTLVKNEDYWQNEEDRTILQAQNCDKITYKVITETAQIAIALETGEVDMSGDIDTDSMEFFYDADAGEPLEGWFVQSELAVPSFGLTMNASENSPMKNQDLRLAALYAVNNEAILETAMNGEGAVTYTAGGAQYNGYQEEMKKEAEENCYAYDLDKSAEYLEKSGYDGESLRLMCTGMMQNVATIVQSQLIEAGLNVEILVYEPALYETYADQDDQWDIMVFFKGKSSGLLTDCWTHFLTTSSHGEAMMIADEVLEELYATCVSIDATDEDIMACHDYFTEKGYFYGIMNGQQYYVGKAGITNFVVSGQFGILPGACTYSSEFSD